MATIDTNYIAPGGTAADDKAERSGSKTPDFYKKFNEPQAYGPNRYEELAEDSITSEASLQQSSELQEYEKQIGGLIGQINQSQQQLDQIAQNPQLLQVPMDQPISFMAKLGAALSNVGGDSSTFMALLKQKQALADQQRQVAFQNVAIQNAFDNQLRSEMIDRLSQDRARLGQLTLIKSKVLDDLGLEGRNREDAAFKADVELVRRTEDYTAADVFADPKNRAAAERAGMSQSELEYQQGWSITRDPAGPADRTGKGMFANVWLTEIGPSVNAQLAAISAGGVSTEDLIAMRDNALVDIAMIETESRGGLARRNQFIELLNQAVAEGLGSDDGAVTKTQVDQAALKNRASNQAIFEERFEGGGPVIEPHPLAGRLGVNKSVAPLFETGEDIPDYLRETALESASKELDTFFSSEGL